MALFLMALFFRFFSAGLSKLIILASSVLLAGVVPAVAGGEQDPLRLATGDRVLVTVLGQAEFSGDFVIDGSGAIAMPIVGAIKIGDRTLDEATNMILQQLSPKYIQRPLVSVKVSEHQPIYVLGDVKSPGTYPYRYGASALSAIASAGGVGTSESTRPASRVDFMLADERLQVLEESHRTLVVRCARLEVQRSESSNSNAFNKDKFSRGDEATARIFGEEQEILEIQKARLKQTVQLLREQEPRLQAEIAGTRAQSEAEARQLRLLQDHMSEYDKLSASGLARRYTIIELQREEARHTGNLARFASEIARLEIGVGEIGLRIQEVENEYIRRVTAELQECRTRLREVEVTRTVAREIRQIRLQQSGIALAGITGEVQHTIVIRRTRGGKGESFRGDWSTQLTPGDIVEVQPTAQPGSTSSAISPMSDVALRAERAN